MLLRGLELSKSTPSPAQNALYPHHPRLKKPVPDEWLSQPGEVGLSLLFLRSGHRDHEEPVVGDPGKQSVRPGRGDAKSSVSSLGCTLSLLFPLATQVFPSSLGSPPRFPGLAPIGHYPTELRCPSYKFLEQGHLIPVVCHLPQILLPRYSVFYLMLCL